MCRLLLVGDISPDIWMRSFLQAAVTKERATQQYKITYYSVLLDVNKAGKLHAEVSS